MKLSAEDAFRQYGDRIFSAAFSVSGNPEDADDAVQNTFLKYCACDKEFTDKEHLRAWLLRVAINEAKDQRRSFWQKHRVSLSENRAAVRGRHSAVRPGGHRLRGERRGHSAENSALALWRSDRCHPGNPGRQLRADLYG